MRAATATRWKRWTTAAAALLAVTALRAEAAVLPYANYLYDDEGRAQASPAAYAPVSMLELGRLDGLEVKDPAHMQVVGETIFLADSGNNRIVQMDAAGKPLRVLSAFDWEGRRETFSEPQGFTVTKGGELYVADTGNGRLVKFDAQLRCERIYNRPEVTALGDDYTYRPLKVGVDSAGRIFVVAQGINRGLMELTPEGELAGFLGAPRVTVDVFTQFWKLIASDEQKDKMEAFVPTEYSNLFVDDEDFLYATTSALETEEVEAAIRSRSYDTVKMVVRLNPMGIDILGRSGAYPPIGDLTFPTKETDTTGGAVVLGASAFTAVTVDEYGTYSCLDIRRGRIFTYDSDGNLLYVFGGSGNQLGAFRSPVAIDRLNGRILVLDKALCRITLFGETDYGACLNRAVACQARGEYDAALEQWENVARYNGNYTRAYVYIGKVYMRKKDYAGALTYLKQAGEKVTASKAWVKYRNAFLAENLYRFLAVLIGAAVCIAVTIRLLRRRRRRRNRAAAEEKR